MRFCLLNAYYAFHSFFCTIFFFILPKTKHVSTLSDVKNIMLCGIEGHVCVQSTALDLRERGFQANVIVDAVSSRSMVDR